MKERREKGSGSITKINNNKYQARLKYKGHNYNAYFDSEKEASKQLIIVKNQIDLGQYFKPCTVKLGDYLSEWLSLYALESVKQSTYMSYTGYINGHIIPNIGGIPLATLTTDQLQTFFVKKKKGGRLDGKAGGLSDKTLRNIFNMLHLALEQAVESKKIMYNPINAVKLKAHVTPEMRVLSVDEQNALMSHVKASDRIESFGILFTLLTGIRFGELLGLKWSDFDFNNKTFKIRRTLNRLQKVDTENNASNKTEIVLSTPKSIQSNRKVPVFNSLWIDLLEYKSKQELLFGELGITSQGFFISNYLGSPMEQRTYTDLYKKLYSISGITDATFHTLRHTFATRALEAGMDVNVLASILGHADPSVTLKVYAHALPDHKKESMDKMECYYNAE